MEMILIEDQYFSKEFFDFLMTGFKESFAHTSLSIEKAFSEYREYRAKLAKIRNHAGFQYYKMLSNKERRSIGEKLRRFMVFYGHRFGTIPGRYKQDSFQWEIDAEFGEHFHDLADENNGDCLVIVEMAPDEAVVVPPTMDRNIFFSRRYRFACLQGI